MYNSIGSGTGRRTGQVWGVDWGKGGGCDGLVLVYLALPAPEMAFTGLVFIEFEGSFLK